MLVRRDDSYVFGDKSGGLGVPAGLGNASRDVIGANVVSPGLLTGVLKRRGVLKEIHYQSSLKPRVLYSSSLRF